MSSKACKYHGGEGSRSDSCSPCNKLRQDWENNQAYCGVPPTANDSYASKAPRPNPAIS